MQQLCHSAMKRSGMKNPFYYYTVISGFFALQENDKIGAFVADED
jgi:hypothetical protein